jgi:selenocysteine lyase/cysteine desulfurase
MENSMDDKLISRLRADTPGCAEVLHFNNAGAALQPEPVYQAVTAHLALEYKTGGYEAKLQAQGKLDHFYTAFATLLNAQPEEIAYAENATRAWDMAFYSIPFKPGDRILTSQAEYASNYMAYLQVAQRFGAKIDVIANDESGQLCVKQLENAIDADVKLITISHIPTQGGLVNPAIEIGRIASKYHILYLLDACQSVGQMPIDVKEIGCSILTGTGRKYLRGPRGTGFLFVKNSIINSLDPPFVDLHAATWIDHERFELRQDAKRFENWESFFAGKIGLSVAVDYALDIGLSVIHDRIWYLAETFRNRLTELPDITVQDQGEDKCGIVTFTKTHENASAVYRRLLAKGINTSVATSDSARLDMGPRGLQEMVRASVHYYNTEEEIERFCEALIDLDS